MQKFLHQHTFNLLMMVFALFASGISIAFATSGTFSTQTLTFADNATANLTVTVGGPLLPPTTTKIRLQFVSDDVSTPLPSSAVNGVSFVLGSGGTSLPFTIAGTGLDDSATFSNKRIQFNVINVAKLLYDVEITHQTLIATGTTENWTLAISGLPPSGSLPTLRVIASVDQGNFSNLAPVGPCGVAPPCPSGQQCQVKDTCSIAGQSCKGDCSTKACPFGQSCQPIKFPFIPWWKYVHVLWPIPFPNPPCLSCPEPWNNPSREGYDRALVSLSPYIKDEPLGAGNANQIRLDIKGGEPLGELVDAGNGEYFQMIEFRKGASPKVSAIAVGVLSKEITVAEQTAPGEPEGRNYLLELLLIVIAGAFGWFIGRRSGSGLTRG